MLQTNPSIFKKLFCVALIFGTAISGSVLAQEPDPKELLARMSAEIAKLDSFVLSGDVYADARLDAGQIIEHSYDVSMSVQKPSQLRLTNRSGENTKELFFDGGVLTVYDTARNFYAQKPIPDGVLSAIDFALNDLGIKAPMLEMISRNFFEKVTGGEAEVAYMGTSLFRGEVHDHIAIRGSEIDMQLWIAAEAPHLPKKMALVSKWESGAPRFVGFMSWNTSAELSDDTFDFVPPKGATEIQFIPEL